MYSQNHSQKQKSIHSLVFSLKEENNNNNNNYIYIYLYI